MKNIKQLLYLFSFLFLAGCASSRNAASADENSVFWKVSGNGMKHDCYLYGTLHLMCKEDIIISEKTREAIKGADDVYFELDLDDPATSLRMMGSMKMKDGKTLQDIFTPEEYTRVEKYFKDTLSASITSMKQMKPFFLVSLMYPRMMTCKKQSGIDQELLKIAREYKKPVKGLESVEFQASVFDSIPYREQAVELIKAIDSMEKGRAMLNDMVDVYRRQDLTAIRKLTESENFGSADNMAILLDKRNINWAKQLKVLMPEKKLFVAVGAGHLPGEQGVISLLRKEGYKVTPIR